MRKKFIFTSDSSFTHVKDKMHDSVTEHIVQDDETKKLYHHVVSYGSWFDVSYSSIFMAYLLKKIGITGFGLAYSADDCKIDLPYYPYHKQKVKTVVELPKFVQLEDIAFEHSKLEVSEQFKQTFVGKTFKQKYESGAIYDVKGEELLKYLFGCSVFRFGEAKIKDKVYPLCCILYKFGWRTEIGELTKKLKDTDIGERPEIHEILERFVELDIDKAIKVFEEELQTKFTDLRKDLIERQEIIKSYLSKHQLPDKEETMCL